MSVDLDALDEKVARHAAAEIGYITITRADLAELLARARRTETAEAENAILRGKVDAYTEDGEPVMPRGWTPVDGGRLDELEAAERIAATYREALEEIATEAPRCAKCHELHQCRCGCGHIGEGAHLVNGAECRMARSWAADDGHALYRIPAVDAARAALVSDITGGEDGN